MRKKISKSIQAKTFISMMVLLIGCCIIIYSMVMVFLPKNYQTELEHQVTSDFYGMVEMLEQYGWEESSDGILEFSMKNNATVEITDENENSVFSVNFANAEDGADIFSVENSGVHIVEEDLKQLFTPFYRVEKSRNRNSGGSGLGLYITKTILGHHGIPYKMENTKSGVKFTAFFL